MNVQRTNNECVFTFNLREKLDATSPAAITEELIKKFQNELQSAYQDPYYVEGLKSNSKSIPIKVKIIENSQEKIIFESSSHDFSIARITNVVNKLHYNLNETFEMTPEAFEFIRRIPEDEWKNIANQINQCPKITEEEVEALKNGDWDHPIYKQPNLEAMAFKAYFQGKIDIDRISIILLQNNCKIHYPTSINLQLFSKNGTIDNEAELMFLKSIQLLTKKDKKLEQNILNELKKLSPQETQFFHIYIVFNNASSITVHLTGNTTEAPCNLGVIKQDHLGANVLIFPPKLLEVIFKTIFGSNVMHPNPVVGFSDSEDFESSIKRDVMIPSQLVKISSQQFRNPIEVYHHDCFHILDETIDVDRKLWVEFAGQLQDCDTSEIREQFVDRDLGYCRKFFKESTHSDYFSQVLCYYGKDSIYLKEIIKLCERKGPEFTNHFLVGIIKFIHEYMKLDITGKGLIEIEKLQEYKTTIDLIKLGIKVEKKHYELAQELKVPPQLQQALLHAINTPMKGSAITEDINQEKKPINIFLKVPKEPGDFQLSEVVVENLEKKIRDIYQIIERDMPEKFTLVRTSDKKEISLQNQSEFFLKENDTITLVDPTADT